MQQLFSIQDKKLLSQVNNLEKDLQQLICDNWPVLFPQYIFITQEFQLKGVVHALGNSGRIDILAYNPSAKRFVFFELKKNYDKNVGHQAANYRHYIRKNFSDVYIEALQNHKAILPDKKEINDKEVEIILIAKEFTSVLIDQAETEDFVTLIKYNWFENDLFLFDYIVAGIEETVKYLGEKPQWTKNIGEIWDKIKHVAKKQAENDADKEKFKDFYVLVEKCIAAKDAQTLYDEAALLHRGRLRSLAKLVLDQKQDTTAPKSDEIN